MDSFVYMITISLVGVISYFMGILHGELNGMEKARKIYEKKS